MSEPGNTITEGAVLEGPHWTEPVRVISVKPGAKRLGIHAIGVHSPRHTAKLIPIADNRRGQRRAVHGQAQ